MRPHFGTLGVWAHESKFTPQLARELELLGYTGIWLGGSPGGDLAIVSSLLDATERINVATGIVNIWSDDARTHRRRAPAYYFRASRTIPARHRHGASGGHLGLQAPVSGTGRLPRRARRRGGAAGRAGARRARPEGAAPGARPHRRRASLPRPAGAHEDRARDPRRGRPAGTRAEGGARDRPRSAPGRSAGRPSTSPTSVSSTTPPTCAGSAGATRTWPARAATS